MKVRVCPNCKEINEAGARTCAKCGADIRTVRPQDEDFVKQNITEEPKAQPAKEDTPVPEKSAPKSEQTLPNADALDEIWLVSEDGQWKTPIPEGETVFGRENFGGEYFDNKRFVSRTHMKLIKLGELLQLQDLESSNGTFINGKRIEKGIAMLNNGDLIGMGGNDPKTQKDAAYLKVVM
jgi:hypothetical protein